MRSLKKNDFWLWKAEDDIFRALSVLRDEYKNTPWEIYVMIGFYLTIARVLNKPHLTFHECVELTKKGPNKGVVYASENNNKKRKL